MTRYTPLLLSLAIAPLMGQSECEPTDTESVTVVFVERDTGEPMANIPVWLGVDGLGPVAFSDESGEAHFRVEGTTHTISYGYYVNSIKSDAIYTYLNHDLSETVTFRVSDQSPEAVEGKTLTGEISGITPEGGHNLDIDFGSSSLYLDVMESPTQTYEKVLPASEPVPFIYAAQNDGQYWFGLPSAFQMILNPEDDVSISLDRTLDQEIQYIPSGIMENPATLVHSYNLNYGGDYAYAISDEIPMDSPQAFLGPIPTLNRGLEAVTLGISLSVEGVDKRYQQGVQVSNALPGNQPVQFKDIHTLSAPSGASMADLEGMSLQIDNTQGDQSYLSLWEFIQKGDDVTYGSHFWRVADLNGVPATITLPIIPMETGLRWASHPEDDPTVEGWAVWAWSSVSEMNDSTGHIMTSTYSDSEFMAPSTARQAQSTSDDTRKDFVKTLHRQSPNFESIDPAEIKNLGTLSP